jgi:transketolase|tara:strand:- start:2145 stop:2783 length:639 start_codon:yes stop_codon:yes gene_type:complete
MERLLELTVSNKLGHLSSTFTTLPILEYIFKHKKRDDKVILSNGHAGLALYTILEKEYGHDAQRMYEDFGIHPYRDVSRNSYASTGSLGSGILIATGMAMGNKNDTVHCVISDGESHEGSVWEALSFIQRNGLKNIKVYVNMNGFCAYDTIDEDYLQTRLKAFLPDIHIFKTRVPDFHKLEGLKGHYNVIDKEDKDVILEMINETTICQLLD